MRVLIQYIRTSLVQPFNPSEYTEIEQIIYTNIRPDKDEMYVTNN
jgi:hypothetical protein